MCVLCQLGVEIIMCVCVYVCVLCVSKACVCCQGGQKLMSDLLELEL